MRYEDLRQVFAQIGVELPPPNSAGWSHVSCVFGPWKHRSGADRSAGMAVKDEPQGTSAYSCPACKSHGRIEAMLRELSYLRRVDYQALINHVSQVETLGAMMLPPWEQRAKAAQEVLGEPLDPITWDPETLFEDVNYVPEAWQYLQARFISPEGAQKAGIRWDPDKRRLVFPVYDDKGNLYGFTGRTVIPGHEPKVLDYASLPKRMLILGEHRWVRGRPIVIVEGLFAYARFLTEGVDEHANVGALLGSVVTPGKAARLRNWMLPIHLILDPDPAGYDGIWGIRRATGRVDHEGQPAFETDVESGAVYQLADHVPVYAPAYPEGVEDPDHLTVDMVLEMLGSGQPLPKPRPATKKTPPRRPW